MKMFWRGSVVVAIACLFLVLVACGDDGSDFATRPEKELSSSETQSSSSLKKSSSSSVVSSSSLDKSSSSVIPQSSSSETSVSSSSVPEGYVAPSLTSLTLAFPLSMTTIPRILPAGATTTTPPTATSMAAFTPGPQPWTVLPSFRIMAMAAVTKQGACPHTPYAGSVPRAGTCRRIWNGTPCSLLWATVPRPA